MRARGKEENKAVRRVPVVLEPMVAGSRRVRGYKSRSKI